MLYFHSGRGFLWATGLMVGTLLAGCETVPYAPLPDANTVHKSPTPVPAQTPAPAPSATARKGGGYYLDDGPGEKIPANLAAVPDAVPRPEPLIPAPNRPYVALGTPFTPMQSVQPFTQSGIGSWYGKKFHGVRTSSGEPYDMFSMTAAHPTLPIPSYAKVTNLDNGRSVIVRVNDRGPFLHNRIIDLSYVAAWKLGYVDQGSARLRVDAIVPDELDGFIANNPVLRSSAESAMQVMQTEARPAQTTRETQPATPPAAALADGSLFLQLGAFSSEINAENFRDYAQNELKWLQQSIRTELVSGKYRLQVGPFRDEGEAHSIGERIAAQIRVQPFLVRR
jgi:rare lipoprotein A